MKLISSSFADQQQIPGDFAFCTPDAVHLVCLGANRNPHLTWSEVPVETKSFAIICHDPDVPSRGDDVNQAGRTVPASLPRVDFFHWVLIDLQSSVRQIAAGEYSADITPRGKAGPATTQGARQGINDYTHWFANDGDMCGDYYGYDGPCPPWNDEIPHRYVFTIFALNIEQLPINGRFSGQQVREAMRDHILDQASLTGVYSLNPTLKL